MDDLNILKEKKMSNKDLVYWSIGYFYYEPKDYKKCINRAKIVLNILHNQENIDRYWIANVYITMGKCYRYLENYNAAIMYLKMGLLYADLEGTRFDAKEALAKTYTYVTEFKSLATECYRECEALCTDTKKVSQLARVLHNRGEWLNNETDVLQAIQIYKELHKEDLLIKGYHSLCIIYITKNMEHKVLNCLKHIPSTNSRYEDIQRRLNGLRANCKKAAGF